ncbi:hypothetical protein [Oceanobacter mangrovi]|uniref:hypothetical protein n=1 Tax=Oceanobacter mangrovi TaxID=2862510 RepID=UPI001C8D7CC8|nr:hypothetical protein [Oceanobacter mangrovi]
MIENLIKFIYIVATTGFILIFIKFKFVREFLYVIFGIIILFLVFNFAFNGEFWFLDLSKLELLGFILIAYLMISNYKYSKIHSLPLHHSLKTDFIYFGLPAFYMSITLVILLVREISKKNYGIESAEVVFTDTNRSTILLLIVIIPLIIRNVNLHFSSVADEVLSDDSAPEVKPASAQQDQ